MNTPIKLTGTAPDGRQSFWYYSNKDQAEYMLGVVSYTPSIIGMPPGSEFEIEATEDVSLEGHTCPRCKIKHTAERHLCDACYENYQPDGTVEAGAYKSAPTVNLNRKKGSLERVYEMEKGIFE